MSDGTAPYANTVYCGFCDVETVSGRFGSLECPKCGRAVEMVLRYSGRDEESREAAVERHSSEDEQ